jgi:osmotically-inducible protein OsmY
MIKTTTSAGKLQKSLSLILCIGALALTVGVTGCAGDRYNQSTGEHIDDATTTARVKKNLSNDPEYKYADVNVTTFKGTVQLSGFTDTRAQKGRAGDIARRTENVRNVQNNITVK